MNASNHVRPVFLRSTILRIVFAFCAVFTMCSIARGDIITSLSDDGDDMGPPGVLPDGDPTLTLKFQAPALTAGKKKLGDGWGRLSVTFDQALTGAMYKIPPDCPNFIDVPGSGFSNGMKTVLVGPGDYAIPVGNVVTLEVSSKAEVKFVSATWVSKKKVDDPNNTPATPLPEPASFLLTAASSVLLVTARLRVGVR